MPMDNTKSALRAIEHGVRLEDDTRWGLTPEDRRQVKEKALALLSHTEARVNIGAGKLLVTMDLVDVKREANRLAEHSSESQIALAMLREALKQPGMLAPFSASLAPELAALGQDAPVRCAAPAPEDVADGAGI